MQASSTADMIKKMKASIEHQAQTAADTIREQANQDSDRNKTHQINTARLKIKEDYQLRKKQIRAQKSVKLSLANENQRMKILKIRDDAVQRSMQQAEECLKAEVQKPTYPELLKKLTMQGLLSLSEPKVEIAVRQADQEIMRGMISSLEADYQEKAETSITLSLSEYIVPDACIGGCVLIARDGQIQISNTLKDRLHLSCQDLYPRIRQIFFGVKTQ